MHIPAELREVAKSVESGQSPKATVRTLLGWFGAQRRGAWIAARIQVALEKSALTTVPNFMIAWIDQEVTFQNAAASSTGRPSPSDAPREVEPTLLSDPTHRVGKLDAANAGVLWVAPDSSLERAITVMMAHDFSQLPLMQGDRVVKGAITWASIGQVFAMGKPATLVSDCSQPHHEISADLSLFDAIDGIVRHGYALVRGGDNKISGIVTTTDLGLQFGRLGEPFLLIGEIENYVRLIIKTRFTVAQIRAAKNPTDTAREVLGAEDLTFGEYVRMLEASDNWKSVRLGFDRDVFIKEMHEILRIRNDVMHFDPDGPSDADLSVLRRWVTLFQRLLALKLI
jgi:CBS domain-containing protein